MPICQTKINKKGTKTHKQKEAKNCLYTKRLAIVCEKMLTTLKTRHNNPKDGLKRNTKSELSNYITTQ